MCGKYEVGYVKPSFRAGSPPHVREIHVRVIPLSSLLRITPACAGNTTVYFKNTNLTEDHPRMCGKYPACAFSFSLSLGSPPHVREIQVARQAPTCKSRITPACAGNTTLAQENMYLLQDHPRMCGKYTKRSIYDATCNLRIPFFHSLLNFQFIS